MYSEKTHADIEALKQKTDLVIKDFEELKQPSRFEQKLPGARPERIKVKFGALNTELRKTRLEREKACAAAEDLAAHFRVEASRQMRALNLIGREFKHKSIDPSVCDPQFDEIVYQREWRAKTIRHLNDAATVAERIGLALWEYEAPPPSEKPKKEKPVDDFFDRARTEIEIAADDKQRALDTLERKEKGTPGINRYGTDARQAIVDSANIAHVASAEAQVAIAGALRDIATNPIGSPGRPLRVQMRRADHADTPDTPFWLYIRSASTAIEYNQYAAFMDDILCAEPTPADLDPQSTRSRVINQRPLRLPFPDTDAYRFLKAATEVFLMINCGVWGPWRGPTPGSTRGPTIDELAYAERRLGITYTASQIQRRWQGVYLVSAPGAMSPILPYLALIRQKLGDQTVVDWSRGENFNEALAACSGIVRERLESPCLLELIWSYWHEEGMLVQTLNAISRRFQNIRTPADRDPLAMIEIDPLRPLNNFLWGYIQDEQHRLTVVRRAYEYDHHYGLSLVGRAVPAVKGADSRKRFLEAFHQLLHLCTIFFKEDDDTTVIADGFPILNALRELHIILTQGAHNQYGDLPWTARHEMLMQEWLLSRGEMREFLPSRIMVAYPEPWMDRVDAMKSLMGWTDTSIMHFRELGIFGERILLGVRFNDWTTVIEPERAANWARFWRPEISGYIHAYRAATGIDLADRVDATTPSMLLRNRLSAQRVAVR